MSNDEKYRELVKLNKEMDNIQIPENTTERLLKVIARALLIMIRYSF